MLSPLWTCNAARRPPVNTAPLVITVPGPIVIPRNVFFSRGGECHLTSKGCRGLRDVPTEAIGGRRSCLHCVQREGR